MVFALCRLNNVAGKYLSGEQVDKVKLTVILTQKRGLRKEREGEKERSGDIAIIPLCRHGC